MKFEDKVKYFFKYVFISPRRFLNLFLVKLSKFLRLKRNFGLPLTIMVEPASFCNVKCPLCPTGLGLIKRKPLMSMENFKKIIDELGETTIHLRLWNWGEPLLNPEFYEMIRYAKKRKIFVNTSTNSFFLNDANAKKIVDSGIDEIIISLDGASEETYKRYRKKGSFKKVIAAIRTLVNEKREKKSKCPTIRIQFVVMNHNEHEIKKMYDLANSLGVDVLFFKSVGTMDIDVKEDIKKYLPSNKFSRYEINQGQLKRKQRVNNKCNIIWEEMVVNTDGSVVPCCNDAHNRYSFGNAFKEPIKKIWNNQRYVSFRKQILKNKKMIPICKNCPGNNKGTGISEIKIKNI